MHTVFVIFGANDTVRENPDIREFYFETQDELNAFILGVNESSGWLEVSTFKERKEAEEYLSEVCEVKT